MIKRGLALSLVLGLGSLAQGDAVLELVPPTSVPPATYIAGEVIDVEIFLSQTDGQEHLVRLLKLHFDDTDPALGLGTHTWAFGGLGYYEDLDNAGGPPGVATAYVGEGECSITLARCSLADGCPDSGGNPQTCNPTGAGLGPRPGSMLAIPGDGTSVKVGTIQVTMPGSAGTYTLDAMNGDTPNADLAAAFSYGYGCDGNCNQTHPDSDFPITFLRANGGGLTGGTVDLTVTGGVVPASLATSNPADEGSWWRSAKNIVRLEFDKDIELPNPGDVQIRKLLMGGAFDVDLSGSFTFSIENNGTGNPRILKIVENGTVLTHRTWYGIDNNSWANVDDSLNVEFLLQVGDADGNKFVTAADLSVINACVGVPGMKADDERSDIDGNRFCTPADLSIANANMSGFVMKPAGH